MNILTWFNTHLLTIAISIIIIYLLWRFFIKPYLEKRSWLPPNFDPMKELENQQKKIQEGLDEAQKDIQKNFKEFPEGV